MIYCDNHTNQSNIFSVFCGI